MQILIIIYTIIWIVCFLIFFLENHKTGEKSRYYRYYLESCEKNFLGLSKEYLLANMNPPIVISNNLWRYDFGYFYDWLTAKDMSLYIYFNNDVVVKQMSSIATKEMVKNYNFR